MVKNGKVILGQGTGLRKGTELGKHWAQNGISGGNVREGRTLQSRGQWSEVREAPKPALNPHWLWGVGPLNLTFLIRKRGIIIISNSQG